MDAGENDDILVGDEIDQTQPIVITPAMVTVFGISGSGNDFMIGGDGRDFLFGVGGNDYLFGGSVYQAGGGGLTSTPTISSTAAWGTTCFTATMDVSLSLLPR